MSTVSLAKAREQALAARKMIQTSTNPIEARKTDHVGKTSGDVADQVLTSLLPSMSNPKQQAQWTTEQFTRTKGYHHGERDEHAHADEEVFGALEVDRHAKGPKRKRDAAATATLFFSGSGGRSLTISTLDLTA